METVLERRQRRRGILVGGLIGFLVAGTLAVPSILPPAVAGDEPFRTLLSSADELLAPKAINGDDFVKPDFTIEPWVSTEALDRITVRKIGYGRTEFVSIVETNTGVYSSDGLESPHIRYPGIVRNSEPGSFLMIVPFEGGFMAMDSDDNCVVVSYGIYC